MARLPRYFVKDQPQHIIQRGNNREPIFGDHSDYTFYLECLQEAAEQQGLAIHSYVLMTNHAHLLVTPRSEHSIGKTMQSLGRRYVQYFNYTYGRTGTLWEGRYKATLIDSDRYLLTCMRYIELNPVRAGMVRHPGDYKWSSYAANARGANNALISPHPVYRQLGHSPVARQGAYQQLFRSALGVDELEAIRLATNTGWVLGNDRFRKKIEQLSGRRSSPKPKGRPRKEKADENN